MLQYSAVSGVELATLGGKYPLLSWKFCSREDSILDPDLNFSVTH